MICGWICIQGCPLKLTHCFTAFLCSWFVIQVSVSTISFFPISSPIPHQWWLHITSFLYGALIFNSHISYFYSFCVWSPCKRESEVTQSCPTLCDPVDCSLPSSSIHGILQARILEWVAISCSRGVFPTQGSNPGFHALKADTLTSEPPVKPRIPQFFI